MMIALILVIIAALGGLFALGLAKKPLPLPLPLALIHGAIAAAGIVVLLLQVMGGTAAGNFPLIALGLFVVAALGGFVVFSFHLRKQDIPIPLTIVHAAAAAAGVVCLGLAVSQL